MNEAAASPDSLGDALTAIRLFAANPTGFGGLWLRGAGPVREALMEQLRALVPQDRPFRRLPPHIDDERLIGGLDVAATLGSGKAVMQRGLLAESEGGIIVATMAERMDAALAGKLAQAMDGNGSFGLVLLDDGLAPEQMPPASLIERLAFFCDCRAIDTLDFPAMPALDDPMALPQVGDTQFRVLAQTTNALGVGSARALTFAARVASDHAALNGRDEIADDDLSVAARLVLASRTTRLPPEPPEQSAEQLESEARDNRDEGDRDAPSSLDDIVLAAAAAAIPPDVLEALAGGRDRRGGGAGEGKRRASPLRGRPLSARPGVPGGGKRLALIDTLRAAAPWQEIRRRQQSEDAERRLRIRKPDLRIRRFEERAAGVTIFAVDASGSSAMARLAEAKGAVELMLAKAYVKRSEVALIAFRGEQAELLLPPTRSLTRARRALAELPGGGGTPLAAGINMAHDLVETVEARGRTPFFVLMTDGKANVASDGRPGRKAAQDDAEAAAKRLATRGVDGVVIDISARPGLVAGNLARHAGLRYMPLPMADAAALQESIEAARDRKVSA